MPIDPNTYSGISSPAGEDGTRELKTLPETQEWTPEIYQLASGDRLTGGEKGLSNLQAQQLANRTLWLRGYSEKAVQRDKTIPLLMRLANDAYCYIIAKGYSKEGYDGAFVDNFEGVQTELDLSKARITKTSKDRRRLTVDAGGVNIKPGCFYQVADDKACEEVRASSLSKDPDGNFVIEIEEPLTRTYDLTKAKIQRSSTPVARGKVFGGQAFEKKTFTNLTPKLEQKDMPIKIAGFPFDHPELFALKDCTVVDGKIVPEYLGGPFGIVLDKAGNYDGYWERVDQYNNDLNKLLDAARDKDLPLGGIGILLNAAGSNSGLWTRLDKEGNDLDEAIDNLNPSEPEEIPNSIMGVASKEYEEQWMRVDDKLGSFDQEWQAEWDEKAPKDGYGIVLEVPGNRSGTWKRIDENHEDFTIVLDNKRDAACPP